MTVSLRLFGAPTLEDGRSSVRFAPERRFRLLAVLAVAQEWVTREALSRLFWPDRTATAARTNLRKLLLEVRQLGLDGIEDTSAGLRWRVPTDLAEFRRAAAQGDWDRAGELGQGPLLQGLEAGNTSQAFDDWLNFERSEAIASWRRGVLAALSGSVDAERGLRWCDALLAIDPLDEGVMTHWMRLCRLAGRDVQADAAYRRHARWLAEEFGLEPSEALRRVASAGPAPESRHEHALTALVGRRREMAQLTIMLDRADCRLVTVLGGGGVGKSHLARHIAQTLSGRYRAVWFVALGDVLTPSALPGRIASRVDPAIALGDDAATLLARHWPAGPTLLVLDAFEHLVDAAEWVEQLLGQIDGLQVVVTSRERLELVCEWLLPLSGLGAPAADASLDEVLVHDGVRLFGERAAQVHPAFDLRAQWRAVRGICAATEGLPLALELAAAWVRMLPCDDIEREIVSGAALLSAPTGGRSLQATFEHSWGLLTPIERDAFARLAVFRGGFTRDAARQVADVALPVLANLVDKSMLQVDPAGRFDRHALLHDWALAKLARNPSLALEMHERHGRWCLAHLLRNHGVAGGGHGDKRAALAAERDNLLQAWRYWVGQGHTRAIESAVEVLSWFHVVEGRLPDGIALFEAAAAAVGTATPVGAHLRAHQAWLTLWMEHYALAQDIAAGALAALEGQDHPAGAVLALRTLAHAARCQGRHRESCRLLTRALRLAGADADARALATLLDARAMACTMLGQYRRARVQIERALWLNDLVGNEAQRMYNEFNLSQALAYAGEADAAAPWAQAAVARAQAIGYRFFEPYVLCQRAAVALLLGQAASAASDVETAIALARGMGGKPALIWAHDLQARVALAVGRTSVARGAAREGAALALAVGNVMMGAALVPAAARAAQAAGQAARAQQWLTRLLACDNVQVPARDEARALLGPTAQAPSRRGTLMPLLAEIAQAD